MIDCSNYSSCLYYFDGMSRDEVRCELENRDMDSLKQISKVLAIRLFSIKRDRVIDTLTDVIYGRIHKGDAFRA